MLCIFLSGSGGMYLGVRVAQYYHYMQVSKFIRNIFQQSNITLLKIRKENLPAIHWKNNKREFKYQGHSYDLIKSTVTRNAVCFHCYLDVKEKHLLALCEQKKNSSRHADKSLPKIQIITCILPQSIMEILQAIEHNSSLFPLPIYFTCCH